MEEHQHRRLFGGKNVIVFSLPGAFTPTCSSTHLPRFNELAPVFKEHGIDAVVCVAVDDPFVMEEWARSQESDQVMLVRDRKIEKMFIEPQKEGDPFEVFDADTMLDYLDPKAARPDQVAILSREGCAFCAQAKQSLRDAGIDFVEVNLPATIRSRALGAIASARTVPQVFINGSLIGGSEELARYLEKARA